MLKTLALLTLTAGIMAAQTSGLTTGEVTYTLPLTNPNSGPMILDDGSGQLANAIHCGGASQPICPVIVAGVQSFSLAGLTASDGTGSCYYYYYSQALYLGTDGQPLCQTSFVGCGSGEFGALYGHPTPSTWTDIPSGSVTLSQVDYPFSSFDGTAVTVINGTCTPIQTKYDLHIAIYHHTRGQWAPPTRWHGWKLIPMQQIDTGSQVSVTPANS